MWVTGLLDWLTADRSPPQMEGRGVERRVVEGVGGVEGRAVEGRAVEWMGGGWREGGWR